METKVRQKKWDGRLKIKIKNRMGRKWDGNKKWDKSWKQSQTRKWDGKVQKTQLDGRKWKQKSDGQSWMRKSDGR